jgi:hypothetical protein
MQTAAFGASLKEAEAVALARFDNPNQSQSRTRRQHCCITPPNPVTNLPLGNVRSGGYRNE